MKLLLCIGILLFKTAITAPVPYGLLPGGKITDLQRAGDHLYAVGEFQLFRAHVDSLQWTPIIDKLDTPTTVNTPTPGFFGEIDGRIFVNLADGKAYYSDDIGENWVLMSEASLTCSAMKLGTQIIAGFIDGMHISPDNGNNWTLLNSKRNVYNLFFYQDTLYINGAGIRFEYSTDSGRTFQQNLQGWPSHTVGVPALAQGHKTLKYQGQTLCATSVGILALDSITRWWDFFGENAEDVEDVFMLGNTLVSTGLIYMLYYDPDAHEWREYSSIPVEGTSIRIGLEAKLVDNGETWFAGFKGGIAEIQKDRSYGIWADDGIYLAPYNSIRFSKKVAFSLYRNRVYTHLPESNPVSRLSSYLKSQRFCNREYHDEIIWVSKLNELTRYSAENFPEITSTKAIAPYLQVTSISDTLISIRSLNSSSDTVLHFAYSRNGAQSFDSAQIQIPVGFFGNYVKDMYLYNDSIWFWGLTANYLIYDIQTGESKLFTPGLAVSPNLIKAYTTQTNVFVLLSDFVYVSDDRGKTWMIGTRGLEDGWIGEPLKQFGDHIVFGYNKSLYYSDWSENTWKQLSLSPPLEETGYYHSIIFDSDGFAYIHQNQGLYYANWPDGFSGFPLSLSPKPHQSHATTNSILSEQIFYQFHGDYFNLRGQKQKATNLPEN